MATKKPLALYSGKVKELQAGDNIPPTAIGYTPEDQANRRSSIGTAGSPSTEYPTVQAILDYVGATPGFSFVGDRPTREMGQMVAYAGSVSLEKNLDSFQGVFAGICASNTNEKNWDFQIDGVSFFSYSAEANLGDWRCEYEITRLNPTTVKISGLFTATGVYSTFCEVLTSVDLDTKPDEVRCLIETPAAAGDITLRKATGENIIAPEYDLVTNGLWAYFEADSYSQSDGSNITTNWTDLSGNGRDASVSGSPTFETAELMGLTLPVVRLGADSNDHFTLPSMSGFSAGTIFIVQKITDTTTNGAHRFGTGTSGHYPFSTDGLIYDEFGTNTRKESLSSYISIANKWHVLHAYSASSNWGLFQNGVRVHTTATNTVSFSSAPLIGTNGAGNFMKTDIAGIYIYSNKMTDARIEQNLAYINQKWGIVI